MNSSSLALEVPAENRLLPALQFCPFCPAGGGVSVISPNSSFHERKEAMLQKERESVSLLQRWVFVDHLNGMNFLQALHRNGHDFEEAVVHRVGWLGMGPIKLMMGKGNKK